MQTEYHKEVGQLAFRLEGDMWNAYYSSQDLCKPPRLIGSVHMAVVLVNEAFKIAFMDYMKTAVITLLEFSRENDIEWPIPAAPEPEPAPAAETEFRP
jgi:hypothetical protein